MILKEINFETITSDSYFLYRNFNFFLILFLIYFVIHDPSNVTINLILQFFWTSLLLIILYFFLRKMNREPIFLKITNDKIILRNFIFFKIRELTFVEVIGFSFTNVIHISKHGNKTRYSAYILYLNDNTKKVLIEYNFKNFNKIKSNLTKTGIKFLGAENTNWMGSRHKYKYDKWIHLNHSDKIVRD